MQTVENCRVFYQSELEFAERDGCGAEYREAAICIFENGFFCRSDTLTVWNDGCEAEWLAFNECAP